MRGVRAYGAYGYTEVLANRSESSSRLPPSVPACVRACVRISSCFAGGLMLFRVYLARRMKAHRAVAGTRNTLQIVLT